jgi:hypothetical protein
MISKGKTYGFRYRARNIYYWSDWSPVLFVLAADKPLAPPRPVFFSATANSISLQMFETKDFGGSTVTEYELWLDQGEINSPFTKLDSYDTTGFIFTHTANFAVDGITTGKIYSFKFRALNSKGFSEFSEILSVAASDPPIKANTPTVDYALSTKNSLFIKWQLTTDMVTPGGRIIGYYLYCDDGLGGAFTIVLNTVGLTAHVNEFLVTGLTTSRQYRFKLVAFNYNPQPGIESDIASFHVCDLPDQWDRPQKLSTSQTSISITWNEPRYNGGCSI